MSRFELMEKQRYSVAVPSAPGLVRPEQRVKSSGNGQSGDQRAATRWLRRAQRGENQPPRYDGHFRKSTQAQTRPASPRQTAVQKTPSEQRDGRRSHDSRRIDQIKDSNDIPSQNSAHMP